MVPKSKKGGGARGSEPKAQTQERREEEEREKGEETRQEGRRGDGTPERGKRERRNEPKGEGATSNQSKPIIRRQPSRRGLGGPLLGPRGLGIQASNEKLSDHL